jgi:hypothetical protein
MKTYTLCNFAIKMGKREKIEMTSAVSVSGCKNNIVSCDKFYVTTESAVLGRI